MKELGDVKKGEDSNFRVKGRLIDHGYFAVRLVWRTDRVKPFRNPKASVYGPRCWSPCYLDLVGEICERGTLAVSKHK